MQGLSYVQAKKLTLIQSKIFNLLIEGKSVNDISKELKIPIRTITKNIGVIYHQIEINKSKQEVIVKVDINQPRIKKREINETNTYTKLKKQPIDLIIKYNIPFCEGNILKYLSRWRFKDKIKDLNKILHYINFIRNNSFVPTLFFEDNEFELYAKENNFNEIETSALLNLSYWLKNFPYKYDYLFKLKENILELIKLEKI